MNIMNRKDRMNTNNTIKDHIGYTSTIWNVKREPSLLVIAMSETRNTGRKVNKRRFFIIDIMDLVMDKDLEYLPCLLPHHTINIPVMVVKINSTPSTIKGVFRLKFNTTPNIPVASLIFPVRLILIISSTLVKLKRKKRNTTENNID